MEKLTNSCLGCRTFFEENQSLPLENITVEYKNFNIPFTEQKHKWALLKTIVSFLNTKGGTIYIGVEDNNCKVQGKQLTRKVRDQFKLALSQLVQRICPVIDLYDKQQLCVQFIPVVKNKAFSGKYVTKINVKQGEPSQTYCWVQKLQMMNEGKKQNENQGENIEIVYSYYRHNMGGTKQVKGIKLIQQTMKKAQKPPLKYTTFHEQCNPQPVELQMQIKRIGFRNIGNRESRRKFEKIFQEHLQSLKAEYVISFDIEMKALIIDFSTVEEFNRINNFIKMNLSILNESYDEVRFIEAGDYLDVFFYENTLDNSSKNLENTPKKDKITPGQQQKYLQIKRKLKIDEEHTQQQQSQEFSLKKTSLTQSQSTKYSLTFTHINPSAQDKLENYLKFCVSPKIKLSTRLYKNTIMVYFSKQEDLQRYCATCSQKNHMKAFQNFGFSQVIKIGISTGHLHIINFDRSKQNKLIGFLKGVMGQSLKQIQILKKGNRYIVDCKMESNEIACEWLDRLLVNHNLKEYKLPGAQSGAAAKMKVILDCQQINI